MGLITWEKTLSNRADLTETGSDILTITGGTNAVWGAGTTIEVAQASATTDGYLSKEDFATFSSSAGDYLTSVTTDDTLSGAGTAADPLTVTQSYVLNSLIDAKGDLIVGSADDTPARLAVGANDYVLTADDSTATGLKWAPGGGGGSGETVVSTITQNNSFSDGNVVYDNAGTWTLAKADDADTLATHMVVNTSATEFDLVSIGKLTVTSHGFGTAGQILYTSADTAGAVTTTEPGTYSNPVAVVLDADTLVVMPWRASAAMGTSMTFGNMCRMHSGVATITGGAGDVTITVPFDWTGGYLTVYVSATSTKWLEYSTAYYSRYETSYDALTNAAYANGHNLSYLARTDGTAHELYIEDKTNNNRGRPKSATSTTFVLDDDGTTCYVKYFVWAPYSQTITFGSNEVITTSGSGAPTSTPVNIGDTYIDTAAKREYKAYGTSTSADWIETYFPLSYIRRTAGNTRGSTNTNVVIYGTAAESAGEDITYVNSAANGDSFKINTSGIYSVDVSAYTNSGTGYSLQIRVGSSVNNSVSDGDTRATTSVVSGYASSCSWVGYISKDYFIYTHKSTAPTANTNLNQITIARVR